MKKTLYSPDDFQRRVPNSTPETTGRSAFRRDYGRLLHSPAFRRLQGKTQLYPGHESDFFRNRLTHSLEVAQIAKGIALSLNDQHPSFQNVDQKIDVDLVEFAALAHDLGHPPFGHNGELALDDCMASHGGFEGNAQTLHILAATEKKVTKNGDDEPFSENGEDQRLGIDATYRSLAAILKYDTPIPSSRKKKPREKVIKGYYESEKDLVTQIKDHVAPSLSEGGKFKTIECHIMDLADDIAYSTYDLEDGLKAGFLNPYMMLDAIGGQEEILKEVTREVNKSCPTATADDVINAIAGLFGLDASGRNSTKEITPSTGDPSPLGMYLQLNNINNNGYIRTALTSSLVKRFMSGIKVEVNESYPCLSRVYLDDPILIQVEALKHLNYQVTIMSPRLKLVEYRGYEIVQEIFNALCGRDGHLLLPQDMRNCYQKLNSSDNPAKMRLISDFVAGMTDRYAIEFFGRLKQGDQSIFKPF